MAAPNPTARTQRISIQQRLAAGSITIPAVMLAIATPAHASASHVVLPGETLSGIAAANGLTTDSLAAWNGFSADAMMISGSSIVVPTIEEAGAGTSASDATSSAPAAGAHTVVAGETLSSIASANGVSVSDLAASNGLPEAGILLTGAALTIPAPSSSPAASGPASGLGTIPSPWGDLDLDASAAQAWDAMRQQSLTDFGVDLYPAGPLSAYRTAEQQGELHDLFLSGAGAPANVPGASSHELGLSVDLATPQMRDVVDQIGWQYGWGKLEAPTEWWHVTYGG